MQERHLPPPPGPHIRAWLCIYHLPHLAPPPACVVWQVRDRIVGNLLEWGVVFLALFWVSMLLTDGGTLWVGWAYLASRVLYPIVALNGGLGAIGPKTPILLATVPAYVTLVMLALTTVRALM